jgi:3-oxoadipate enol-lactonase
MCEARGGLAMTKDDIWVAHDGLRFRCRVDGTEGAPWVVFSNSLLTDLSVWDEQVEALGDHFQILRYDQRGHGRTSVPPGATDFDELGSDLLALIDHFGIEQCTLVGLSMGVPTGLHIMRHQPRRISRLVFCDGQAATAPGGAAAWEERIANARRDGMEELARLTVERWFSEEFRAAGRHVKALRAAAATPLEGFIACARGLQDYQYMDVLATIAVPTLILVGENDGNMPVSMRAMCEAIPGALMHVIPDAGHIPNYEQPELFNRHLLDFLLPDDGAASRRKT